MKPKFDSVFLAVGVNNWPKIGQKWSKNDDKKILTISFFDVRYFLFRALWRKVFIGFLVLYILTILDLFWTNFRSILDTYGPNLGFSTKCMMFHMKNNALLFKWSGKMVLADPVDLIVCFWPFWANFGPILAQFRTKMPKYDPFKPFFKIFM